MSLSSHSWIPTQRLIFQLLKEDIIRIVHFMNPPKKMKEHFFVTDRWKSPDLVNRPACLLESWKIRSLSYKDLMSYWPKSWKKSCDTYIKKNIRSSHNFAYATTAMLLWHMQNCGLIKLSETTLQWCIFTIFGLWGRKLFVKWFKVD